jgi:hypothetical protein
MKKKIIPFIFLIFSIIFIFTSITFVYSQSTTSTNNIMIMNQL